MLTMKTTNKPLKMSQGQAAEQQRDSLTKSNMETKRYGKLLRDFKVGVPWNLNSSVPMYLCVAVRDIIEIETNVWNWRRYLKWSEEVEWPNSGEVELGTRGKVTIAVDVVDAR